MKPITKTIWIILFAVAMGYLEAAVVVYLRELYYPEGFNFPLRAMAQDVAVTELFREAATLIMILAVGVLAAEYWLHRFAWFLVVFSVWDIFYYIFLKLLVGWPDSFLTTDILFLLPSMWTGPVIAPLINSLTMILLALVILRNRKSSQPVMGLSKIVWTLLILGSVVILFTYLKDFASYFAEFKRSNPSNDKSYQQIMFMLSTRFIPRTFDWLFFCIGVLMHFTAILLIHIKSKKNKGIPESGSC